MNLRKLLLIAFVLSGMAALIYEITWIRPLQFTLGSTIYTISIIFAAFMAGLALGSWIISKHVDSIKNLPKTYALLELGIGIYGILLVSLFNILPGIYNFIYPLKESFYLFEFVQFILAFLLLLIPTTLMGATLPVIAKFYTREKIGKGVGEVYSANNIGAILGSFSAGFILIPLFGIETSIIIAGVINILIASVILLISDRKTAFKIITISLILFISLAYFGNYNIQKLHSGGFYRTDPIQKEVGNVVYYEEGTYATITVRSLLGQGYALFINGKGQGGTEINDLRVNFLLAYLPLLINQELDDALVVGLGTGTTSGQLSQFTQVKTIEIEPKVIGATDYFTTFNSNVLNNPNHDLIIDDARNYLVKTDDKYDAIIQEPSDPWQQFSTDLYSKEFFELVRDHLDEKGLFVKWIPIYTMSPEDFRNFYKTFDSVFPNNLAFANIKPSEDTPIRFSTTEILLIGSKENIEFDLDNFIDNYNNLPEINKQHLSSLRLNSGEEIYNLFLFKDKQIEGYADSAKLITDDKPILEFSTAKKVLSQNPEEVIEEIKRFLEKNDE